MGDFFDRLAGRLLGDPGSVLLPHLPMRFEAPAEIVEPEGEPRAPTRRRGERSWAAPGSSADRPAASDGARSDHVAGEGTRHEAKRARPEPRAERTAHDGDDGSEPGASPPHPEPGDPPALGERGDRAARGERGDLRARGEPVDFRVRDERVELSARREPGEQTAPSSRERETGELATPRETGARAPSGEQAVAGAEGSIPVPADAPESVAEPPPGEHPVGDDEGSTPRRRRVAMRSDAAAERNRTAARDAGPTAAGGRRPVRDGPETVAKETQPADDASSARARHDDRARPRRDAGEPEASRDRPAPRRERDTAPADAPEPIAEPLADAKRSVPEHDTAQTPRESTGSARAAADAPATRAPHGDLTRPSHDQPAIETAAPPTRSSPARAPDVAAGAPSRRGGDAGERAAARVRRAPGAPADPGARPPAEAQTGETTSRPPVSARESIGAGDVRPSRPAPQRRSTARAAAAARPAPPEVVVEVGPINLVPRRARGRSAGEVLPPVPTSLSDYLRGRARSE